MHAGICLGACCALALAATLALETKDLPRPGWQAEQPEGPQEPKENAPHLREHGLLSPAPIPREAEAPATTEQARRPLKNQVKDRPQDPCAALTLRLEAVQRELAQERETSAALRKDLKRAERALEFEMNPEDTPYGAFLASPEGESIVDPKHKADIRAWLGIFPVFLRPGEATWIVERKIAGDWKLYAPTSELAIIRFLGKERLIRELPPESLAELRAEYPDDSPLD